MSTKTARVTAADPLNEARARARGAIIITSPRGEPDSPSNARSRDVSEAREKKEAPRVEDQFIGRENY